VAASDAGTSARRPRAPALLLVILTVVAYSNSLTAGFPLDNTGLILQDARVHAATFEHLDLILRHSYWWPVGESGLYRPVTTLSYLFNYGVLGNGDRPLGYHVVNLALHIANALLVYAVACLVMAPAASSAAIAFAIAAVWAVHPISTEAVTNIVGRADLIAGLAVLAGLLMFVKILERTGTARVLWLVALTVTTAIGVFAKESAIVVAPLIAVWFVTFPQSGDARRVGARAHRKRSPARSRRVDIGVIGGAVTAVMAPLVFMWIQRMSVLGAAPAAEYPFVDNPIVGASAWIAKLTALTVMFRYLWLLAWPMRLSADYSYGQIALATGSTWNWAALGATLLAIAGGAVLWRRDRRAFFFAAFAAITFLPASNVLFATGTIMAERVMYLPSVGVIALVVIGVERLVENPKWRPAVAVALGAVVVALMLRTWIRNRDWHDDLSLWSATVRAAPRSFKAHRGLAEALYDGDPTRANIVEVAAESDRAVAILDSLPDALNDARTYRQAGADYMELGDAIRNRIIDPSPLAEMRRAYERAALLLDRSVKIIQAAHGPFKNGVAADAYRLLSAVYVRLDDAGKAIETAALARQLDPGNVVGYRQSAAAFLSASRHDDAAVALMTGQMITGDGSLRAELVDLYTQGLDPVGCAVVTTANGPAISAGCETVRRHACAAAAEAVQIQQRAGRADEATRLKEGAARQFHCQ
jgi:protein O-mannosyl-transferase